MGRRTRVAAVLAVLVLLLGAAACGDDAPDEVEVSGDAGSTTTTTAPATGDQGGSGLKPAPQAGDPAITGPIADLTPLSADASCDDDGASATTADPDQPVSDDDPAACTPAPELWGTVVVQDGVDPGGQELAASISVPRDTPVLVEDGPRNWRLGSLDDLAEGVGIQVWFTGPVAESYPVQATASSIVIEAS